MAAVIGQPVIRGIQSVGSVDIKYRYNAADNLLIVPKSLGGDGLDASATVIDTTGGISIAGFRLDGEFLRANPQIASSIVIPILGGGGVALTNNNRTGQLTLNCAKVSTPDTSTEGFGSMLHGSGIGPVTASKVYDVVYLAQVQQAQPGGDSVGASILISFNFCGKTTSVQFDSCTIATVDPLALTGNDAASYTVVINYLDWNTKHDNDTAAFIS